MPYSFCFVFKLTNSTIVGTEICILVLWLWMPLRGHHRVQGLITMSHLSTDFRFRPYICHIHRASYVPEGVFFAVLGCYDSSSDCEHRVLSVAWIVLLSKGVISSLNCTVIIVVSHLIIFYMTCGVQAPWAVVARPYEVWVSEVLAWCKHGYTWYTILKEYG